MPIYESLHTLFRLKIAIGVFTSVIDYFYQLNEFY